MSFIDEFLKGMRDCEQGRKQKPSQSNDYQRGYVAQKESEEIKRDRQDALQKSI